MDHNKFLTLLNQFDVFDNIFFLFMTHNKIFNFF